MSHVIKKCRAHGNVISQCRCPATNKSTYLVDCIVSVCGSGGDTLNDNDDHDSTHPTVVVPGHHSFKNSWGWYCQHCPMEAGDLSQDEAERQAKEHRG